MEVLKRDNREIYVISQELGIEKYFPRQENIRPTTKVKNQVNTVSEAMDFLKKNPT